MSDFKTFEAGFMAAYKLMFIVGEHYDDEDTARKLCLAAWKEYCGEKS